MVLHYTCYDPWHMHNVMYLKVIELSSSPMILLYKHCSHNKNHPDDWDRLTRGTGVCVCVCVCVCVMAKGNAMPINFGILK